MPLTDAYDLSGLNDDRFLCGPYVCTPFANEQLPSQLDIESAIRDLEPKARTLPGAVPDNGYYVLDVFSSSTADSLFPGVPVHKKIRNYHTSLVAKFGVFQFLTETLKTSSGTHELHSQLHWYPARPKTNIQLHHDTVGSTFFVILHYFSDRTIYGPEFVFDTVGMQNPFHRADQSGLVSMHPSRGVRQGPVDVDGPWPQSLRDRMKAARVALNEAYGNRPMIKNALIPPNGALGFVDELVHHTTPLMDRRTSPEHQKGFSTVIIRDQNLSAPESFSFPSVTRERSTSFELKNDSMNRTAMTATRDQARAFMRIWVAVRKK